MRRIMFVLAACLVCPSLSEARAQSSDLESGGHIRLWSSQPRLNKRVGSLRSVSADSIVVDLESPRRRVAVLLSRVDCVEVSAGTRSPQYGAIRGALKWFSISTIGAALVGGAMDVHTHPTKGRPSRALILSASVALPATILGAVRGRADPPGLWERVLWRKK